MADRRTGTPVVKPTTEGRGASALLLLAVVVTFVVPITQGVGIRDFRTIILFHLASAVTLWMLSRGNVWLGLFGVLCATSLAFNATIWSVCSMLTLLAMYGVYYASSKILSQRVGLFLNVLCGVVVVQCIYQFWQFFGVDPIFHLAAHAGESERAVGFTGNALILSWLCAFATPAFFRGRWIYFLPLPLISLALCGTSTPVISLAFGGGVAAFIFLRQKFQPVIAILCLAMLFMALTGYIETVDKRDMFTNNRWVVWADAVELIKEKPLQGHGLGTWQTVYTDRPGGKIFRTAHNDYLQAGVELGVIALTLAVGFVVATGIRLIRGFGTHRHAPVLTAMFLTLAVSAIGHFPFHTPEGVWAVMFLGVLNEGGVND